MMAEQIIAKFNQHLAQLLTTLALVDTTDLAINRPPRLVVALSGGVDSVVLLHLLVQFQKTNPIYTVLAHNVNHGLSHNAEHWALFCTNLCQQFNITLLTSKVFIKQQSRSSLEALARAARYQCFQEKMHENDIILTGHHQDDQLETLLLALKRGSGSTGLQGIHSVQAFHQGYLIRPLLGFSRQQLINYAEHYSLSWVEDESNQDTAFDRNFIRQQISPLLTARWPSIAASASRTAQLCQEQQTLLNEVAEQDLVLCLVEQLGNQTLSISALSKFSDARRNNILRFWLKSHRLKYPSRKQLNILWTEVALALADKQPKLQLERAAICRYQDHLYVVHDDTFKGINSAIRWEGQSILWIEKGYMSVNFSAIDPVLAKQYRIECCLRAHLDASLTCLPVERNKARSIKKLLHEYKVPPWLRDQVVFVLINGHLVQAIGLWHCQPMDTAIADLPPMPLSLFYN